MNNAVHSWRRLNIYLVAVVVFCGYSNIFAQAQDIQVVIENDGWKLVGNLLRPKSKKMVPAVVLLNKANGRRSAYEKMARHLAKNGIASLRIDLRAHGESINKGKFGPPFGADEKMRALLVGSDTDVTVAVNYLKKLKGIDPNRIGLVGASYSGEEMAISARKNGYGKAYVALSPGSFGEESLNSIDSSTASWLFITSAEERFLKGFLSTVRQKSKTAQTMEVAGDKHATDILDSNSELAEMLAVWFKYRL